MDNVVGVGEVGVLGDECRLVGGMAFYGRVSLRVEDSKGGDRKKLSCS